MSTHSRVYTHERGHGLGYGLGIPGCPPLWLPDRDARSICPPSGRRRRLRDVHISAPTHTCLRTSTRLCPRLHVFTGYLLVYTNRFTCAVTNPNTFAPNTYTPANADIWMAQIRDPECPPPGLTHGGARRIRPLSRPQRGPRDFRTSAPTHTCLRAITHYFPPFRASTRYTCVRFHGFTYVFTHPNTTAPNQVGDCRKDFWPAFPEEAGL